MIRPPEDQEAYVRAVASDFSPSRPRNFAIEAGTWQAIYTEIYIELQLARKRIEQLEQSTPSFQEQT